jgi:hypothetical protein
MWGVTGGEYLSAWQLQALVCCLHLLMQLQGFGMPLQCSATRGSRQVVSLAGASGLLWRQLCDCCATPCGQGPWEAAAVLQCAYPLRQHLRALDTVLFLVASIYVLSTLHGAPLLHALVILACAHGVLLAMGRCLHEVHVHL